MNELFPTIKMRQETFVVELCLKLDFFPILCPFTLKLIVSTSNFPFFTNDLSLS